MFLIFFSQSTIRQAGESSVTISLSIICLKSLANIPVLCNDFNINSKSNTADNCVNVYSYKTINR